MNDDNLALFKQALSEGLSNRFDSIANSYTDDVVCSEQHKIAMRAIVYGKAGRKSTWSPKMKRIVAILVAAALLLTSCGIIFRNEIKEIFEEFYVTIVYGDDKENNQLLDEIYELGYIPYGYKIEDEFIDLISVNYRFVDDKGNNIIFKQNVLNGTEHDIDSENGYSKLIEVEGCELYYRKTNTYNYYIWHNEKYLMTLSSSKELNLDEITKIINGIKEK